MEVPGNLNKSPRKGTKVPLMVSVCFLRTQQRAKSQCMINVLTPVGAGSSGLVPTDLAMRLTRGWVSGFRLVPYRGLAGGSHSTESLILAQDERWRRA